MVWIWVRAWAGDGAAMWLDTTAMRGAETGARAGVGTWTGEGREAEAGTWAEFKGPETGAKAGVGVVTCIRTGAEVKAGAGLKAFVCGCM